MSENKELYTIYPPFRFDYLPNNTLKDKTKLQDRINTKKQITTFAPP